MITTRIEPPLLTESFNTVVTVDTKANMLMAANIWGYDLPKSWRKDEIARSMAYGLKHEPQYIWDNLGQEAIDQISEIVSAGKGRSITVPHNPEKFSRLQKSLLVICSEPKNGKCDLYMLDEVYDIFKKLTDGHLEMLTNITEQYAKDRLKEMEEASKASEAKLPLNLLPALTSNPPEMPLEGSQVAFKLIRSRVMELTLRLSANRYMVCYFFMQEGYIHAVCNWGNILDFVWNGVEVPYPGADYHEVKRPFRKKYPTIASAFGQKTDEYGKCLSEPYITTIGWEGQPKTWFISYKIYGLDFADLVMIGPMVNNEYATAIGNFRDLSIKFFKEIMRSDAKSPKARMKEYFGFDILPVDEDFEGFGLMPDSEEWEDGEDQANPLPEGVDMDKIKDIISELYKKGLVK